MNVNEQIKAARKAKGWSQEETARRCGMSLNNYARIERGDNGTTIRTLDKIAATFGLKITLK